MTEEQVPTVHPNDILTLGESEIMLFRVTASIGNGGLGTSRLLIEGETVTLDPGYTNTTSCESTITSIDDDEEIPHYQDHPIKQPAKNLSFLEVAHLLIYREFPDTATLEPFIHGIQRYRLLHEDFKTFFTALPHCGHPMAILRAGIAGLVTYYEDTLNPRDSKQLDTTLVLLLTKAPTMISCIAKRATNLSLLYPDSARSYTEDFICMIFGMPYQTYDTDPTLVHVLDMLLILHADRERNYSTSTVRLVGSSQADPYTSVAAGVGALAGPLHDEADEAILRMFHQIRDTGEPVWSFANRVKSKVEGVHLMGFDHRVYGDYGPRAALVKETAHEVLSRLDKRDEFPDVVTELENIALNNDYFRARKLYPNMDLYTGLIHSAMGFLTKMFTPLSALGRLSGRVPQYVEMTADSATKIGRPRQVYVGEVECGYVPLRMHTPRLSA